MRPQILVISYNLCPNPDQHRGHTCCYYFTSDSNKIKIKHIFEFFNLYFNNKYIPLNLITKQGMSEKIFKNIKIYIHYDDSQNISRITEGRDK
jgi:hypothetical protein